MAKVHSQTIKRKAKRQAKHQTRRKARVQELHRKRERQRMRHLQVGRAARDPQPTPRARGYLAARFWERFKLSEALEAIGVSKEGLPLGHILLVVMLFGLLNAASLAGVVQAVNQDVVLCAVLDLKEELEVKQLYRGLAMLTPADYRAWMRRFLQELQRDPRTASRRDGVLAGDGTQKRRSYSRKRSKQAGWLRVIYLHDEKRCDLGYEVESTHYADPDKDYPVLSAIYEPSAEQAAAQAEARQRQALGLDLRRSQDRIVWLKQQVAQNPEVAWIELGARDLNPRMRAEVEALNLPWVGISGQNRYFLRAGRSKPQTAKTLLQAKPSQRWLELPELGYALLWLGAASCSIGAVVLLIAEHAASGQRQLYVLPPQSESAAIAQLTQVLEREQATHEPGRLDLMVTLVQESRQAGIRAETGVFDRGYFSLSFILQVLKAGLRRVIIPAKKGVNYVVAGLTYALPDLWSLLAPDDFAPLVQGDRTYQVASLRAALNGLGQVQLVFVHQLSRQGQVRRSFVLLCTDVHFPPAQVLQAYLLRWRIEVGYREVKQNHAFGRTLSGELSEVYGQIVLSFLAYTCLMVTRLLTAPLHDKTLGWIKREYFNALVELQIAADGLYTILFPPWLLDTIGLPEF